ncbi:MAG: hypothetical protein EAZ43_11975 [Betaproteobacteria bacterium]|nr:MAG: hypothetical protein EAZ43_11975 [Betaproteobacteria bacterium]
MSSTSIAEGNSSARSWFDGLTTNEGAEVLPRMERWMMGSSARRLPARGELVEPSAAIDEQHLDCGREFFSAFMVRRAHHERRVDVLITGTTNGEQGARIAFVCPLQR